MKRDAQYSPERFRLFSEFRGVQQGSQWVLQSDVIVPFLKPGEKSPSKPIPSAKRFFSRLKIFSENSQTPILDQKIEGARLGSSLRMMSPNKKGQVLDAIDLPLNDKNSLKLEKFKGQKLTVVIEDSAGKIVDFGALQWP